jgi:hypothetical protein
MPASRSSAMAGVVTASVSSISTPNIWRRSGVTADHRIRIPALGRRMAPPGLA